MESLVSKKRARDDSDELELNSVEIKRIRDDLLVILDDSELCDESNQDLDSFMKSFEEEISAKSSPVVDLSLDSGDVDGESRPELGYLFEASDDELGLPPSENLQENESVRVLPELSSELWKLDDQISSYDDSFEFGSYGYVDSNNSYNGEYVTLDGLFDYTDLGFGSSDLGTVTF